MLSSEKLKHWMVIFAQWFIILGFHLELYEPFEEVEAHWWLMKISNGSLFDLSSLLFNSFKYRLNRIRLSTFDDKRFIHRWECLLTLFPCYNMESLIMNDGDHVVTTATTTTTTTRTKQQLANEPCDLSMNDLFIEYSKCFFDNYK